MDKTYKHKHAVWLRHRSCGLKEEIIDNLTYPQDITIEAECVLCGKKASRKGLVQWEEWEDFN